jgi:hypothetical protein
MSRLLLIDGDADTLLSCELMLREAGHPVTLSWVDDVPPAAGSPLSDGQTAHAAARIARAMVSVIDSATDPRTISDWGHLVYASSGALRNWCRTAGVSPRRALVFSRLLRAVVRGQRGDQRLENLLDVADRRTVVGLLRSAGFRSARDFPRDIESFLRQQTVMLDADVSQTVRQLLSLHSYIAPL